MSASYMAHKIREEEDLKRRCRGSPPKRFKNAYVYIDEIIYCKNCRETRVQFA